MHASIYTHSSTAVPVLVRTSLYVHIKIGSQKWAGAETTHLETAIAKWEYMQYNRHGLEQQQKPIDYASVTHTTQVITAVSCVVPV